MPGHAVNADREETSRENGKAYDRADTQSSRLEALRGPMVNTGLAAMSVLALPMLVFSVMRDVALEQYGIMAVHIGVYLAIVIAVALRRVVHFHVRAVVLFGSGLISGAMGLYTYGLIGMGVPFFMVSCIILVMIYGVRAAVICLAASMAVMGLIGFAATGGRIPLDFDVAAYAVNPSSWVTAVFAMAGFISLAYVIMARYYGTLNAALEDAERSARELKSTKSYLDNVMNSMPSLLVGIDSAGQVVTMNREAERQSGMDVARASGLPAAEVFPPYESIFTEAVMLLGRGEVIRRERVERLVGNERRTFNVVAFPLVENGVRGAVVRIDDATEAERRDEQLRQAQKMELIGNLAGGIAHDFNNILTGVIGGVTLAENLLEGERFAGKENVMSCLDVMRLSSDRAADVIRQLLTLSRRKERVLSPVDLDAAAEGVLALCRSTLPKSVEIAFRPSSGGAWVMADPAQIEQVALNLCVNASQAMTVMRTPGERQGGVLSVEVTFDPARGGPAAVPGEDCVVLTVRDTGVGMSEEVRGRIFEPFFSTKSHNGGTGLGLTMVSRIVEDHGGRIHVDSFPGKGTAVSVRFPALPADRVPPSQEEKGEDSPRGNATVLVIDDDPIVLKAATAILGALGYTAVPAPGGDEGIRLFSEAPARFGAVLLDMAMPGRAGGEVFDELIRAAPGVKVLFTSGFHQDSRMEELVAAGRAAFIPKPFTMDGLARKLRDLLAGDR